MRKREQAARPTMDRDPGEATERQKVVTSAKTWLRTPFRDQGDVKGPNGAVDCAMLLVRTFQEADLIDPAFDPRPYPPQWHLHRNEERFLKVIDGIVAARGRGAEVPNEAGLPAAALARAGDVIVYRVGRCYSHGGLVIGNGQLIHACYKTGHVAISALNEVELTQLPDGRPRPYKLFDFWAR